MRDDHFIKDPALPCVEGRRSKSSERQYKPHMHRAFSIGAIDQGEVIYRVNGHEAKLRPGNLALINPETLHSCNPADSRRRSYYVLHLDMGWCLQIQQALWTLESFRPVKEILLDDSDIYQQFINVMDSMMDGGDPRSIEHDLVDFAKDLFLKVCEPEIDKSTLSVPVEQLKQQLNMDLDVNTSLAQLSSTFHLNPYTLLRKFKASTGLTPHAYRLNCRIELARKLLQKGIDPAQVALECGFYDQSHFYRHFKAMTTVTPREYQVNFIQ